MVIILIMSTFIFTDEQVKALNNNPNVIAASNRRISYTTEFKKLFVEKYAQGMTPREIFYEAGFDVIALGNKRIERASDRWRQMNNDGRFGEGLDFVPVHLDKRRNKPEQDDRLSHA